MRRQCVIFHKFIKFYFINLYLFVHIFNILKYYLTKTNIIALYNMILLLSSKKVFLYKVTKKHSSYLTKQILEVFEIIGTDDECMAIFWSSRLFVAIDESCFQSVWEYLVMSYLCISLTIYLYTYCNHKICRILQKAVIWCTYTDNKIFLYFAISSRYICFGSSILINQVGLIMKTKLFFIQLSYILKMYFLLNGSCYDLEKKIFCFF